MIFKKNMLEIDNVIVDLCKKTLQLQISKHEIVLQNVSCWRVLESFRGIVEAFKSCLSPLTKVLRIIQAIGRIFPKKIEILLLNSSWSEKRIHCSSLIG